MDALLAEDEKRRQKQNDDGQRLLDQAFKLFSDVACGPDDPIPDEEGNPKMNFNNFYNSILQPYLSCFSCHKAERVLQAIDREGDGDIEWNEWRFWCIWALRTYPGEINTLDDLYATIFRR